MTEEDKMGFRVVAFLLGASLCLFGIFAVDRKREGKLLDCSLSGVNCKTTVHKIR